jgi:2,5-diketo-D-gluconate reductase A
MTEIPVARLNDGAEMPVVGFGTWQMHGQQAYDGVRWALAAGYRHIDTATMYQNEAEVGRAVRDSGVDRDELFITTKLAPGSAGRERQTLADSLGALGTGFVNLWLIHWPPRRQGASEKVWRAFLELRSEGLCRSVGVSNYSPAEIDELTVATGQTPAVNQVPWSPSGHDVGLLAAHGERGVVVEGYSPLKGWRPSAGGRGGQRGLKNPELVEIATTHGVTAAQVVLRWHVQMGIVVIPKSAHRERIESNLDLFGFELTDEEMERLTQL